VAGALILRRRRDSLWVLLLASCVVAPALALIVVQPDFYYPRYFIIPVTGMLLLLAACLAKLHESRRWMRWGAIGLALLYLAGNARYTSLLVRDHRGKYLAALTYIAERSEPGLILIGGDHDHRQPMMIRFYAPFLPSGTEARYVPTDRTGDFEPQWLLFHTFYGQPSPPDHIGDRFGRAYERLAEFRSGPLSGWTCHVYQRFDPPQR
jgi:hypothetical protein